MSLTIDQLADLTLETYKRLVKKGAFVGLQTDLQDFVAVREQLRHEPRSDVAAGTGDEDSHILMSCPSS